MIAAIPFDAPIEFVSGHLVGKLGEDGSSLVHEESPVYLSREKASEFRPEIEIENACDVDFE